MPRTIEGNTANNRTPSGILGDILHAGAFLAASDVASLGIRVGAAYESLKYGIELIERAPHDPLHMVGGVLLTAFGVGVVKNTAIKTVPYMCHEAQQVLQHAAEGKHRESGNLFEDIRDIRDTAGIEKAVRQANELRISMAKRHGKQDIERQFT